MRRRTLPGLAIGALAMAALAVGVAGPASAADNPAWLNGFPPASAINANLGTYATPPDVQITGRTGSWYVCSELRAKPASNLVMAMYATTPSTPSTVRADARVYASPAKALAAFNAIASSLRSCAISRTVQAEPGSKDTWVETTTAGTSVQLTADGPTSLYVYTTDKASPGVRQRLPLGANYEVLTLVGNTILDSTVTVEGVSKLTAAQRQSAVAFARAFVDSWTKVNP